MIPATINMKYQKLLLLSTCLLWWISPALSQTWELGVGAGASTYTGDLNPDQPFKFSGPAAGGFVRINLDPYWAIGMHYNYGRVEASDARSSRADFQQRNLKFYTPMHEASAQVDFNFMEYFSGGGGKAFTPYIFAGIGGVIFNPKVKLNDEVRPLRLYRTEDQLYPYRNYAITVPYGAGLKIRIQSNLSLNTQIGFRTVYTDYLDDVSGVYHRLNTDDADRIYLANPALDNRTYGAQRGDSRKHDGYMFTQVGISYTFLCKNCLTF